MTVKTVDSLQPKENSYFTKRIKSTMLIILEKTYYFDTEGFGKKKRRRSMIRLVEKNDVFYNPAKRHNDLYKLQDGLKLIIKNNLGVFTIAGNPIYGLRTFLFPMELQI